jgi:hypothetical protein
MRTWPYGTKKVVKVLDLKPYSSRFLKGYLMAVEHRDEPGEITLLTVNVAAFDGLAPMPAVGQLRQMEFRPGGPTGAHWMLLNGEVRS